MERSENFKQSALNRAEDNIRSNKTQNLSIEAERATELEEITESATEEAKEEKKAEKALTKEKQTVVSIAKNVLQLTCDIDDVLTYATVHNGAHIVRDICVKNISESDLDGLMLRSVPIIILLRI